jgi:hypothetical protein
MTLPKILLSPDMLRAVVRIQIAVQSSCEGMQNERRRFFRATNGVWQKLKLQASMNIMPPLSCKISRETIELANLTLFLFFSSSERISGFILRVSQAVLA